MAFTVYFHILGKIQIADFWSRVFRHMTWLMEKIDFGLWARDPAVARRTIEGIFLWDFILLTLFLARHKRLGVESIFCRQMRHSHRRINWLRGVFGTTTGDSLRWTLPEPPSWGGLGALLWRKSQEILRYHRVVFSLYFIVILAFSAVVIFLMHLDAGQSDGGFRPWHLLFCAEVFTLLAILFARFADFRSDGDKIEMLFALPVSSIKLIVAELIPAILCFSLLLAALEAVGWILYAHYRPWAEASPYVAWGFLRIPISIFVFMCVTNIIALLFPLPRATSGRVVLNLLAQYGAELFGLGLLARGLYCAHKWAFHIGHAERPLLFSTVSLLAVLIAAVPLWGLLVLALNRFDCAKTGL